VNLRNLNISARIPAVLATAVATVAAASVVAAPASAATSPGLSVSVSTSNTTPAGQLPFVAGTVYAVTYTLTDNLSDPLTGVSFSDELPAGLTIAPDTTATASHCVAGPDGGPKSLDTESGATSIRESGFTVAPGVGEGCSLEVFVTAGFAAASASDTPGSASFVIDGKSESESNFASSSAAASASVEFPQWNVSVIARPALAISYPATGAHFAFDQKVRAKLSGTAAVGDSILHGNLYAIDENDTEFTSGQRIATDIPGTHTLTVWASTSDGFIGAGQKITYTVGSPAPVDLVSHRLGSVSFDVKYLATGRVSMKLHYGATVIGYVKKWVHVGKEMPVWIALNAAGERLRASHMRGFKARLSLEYQIWDVRVFKDTPVNVVQNIEIH
jgi:uncharacterized repeat protein (TIGR01451 family)